MDEKLTVRLSTVMSESFEKIVGLYPDGSRDQVLYWFLDAFIRSEEFLDPNSEIELRRPVANIVQFKLDGELVARLKAYAREKNISSSLLVRMAILQGLRKAGERCGN